MRKIFSVVVVALVTLFAATSCELTSGTDPNPNRANQLLWGRVNDAVYQQYDHILAVAHLNDTLVGKTYPKSLYKPCKLEVKDNIYTLTYGTADYASWSYRIKSDGKRLDEGGEWAIYYRTGTYMEYVKLGNVVGIVGESAKFNLSIDNSEYAKYYYGYYFVADSEVAYEYDDVKETLCVKYNTFQGITTDTTTTPDYTIEFAAVEPLVLSGEIEQGKVDILYKDFVENTSRQLSVVIANKIVTFVPRKVE